MGLFLPDKSTYFDSQYLVLIIKTNCGQLLVVHFRDSLLITIIVYFLYDMQQKKKKKKIFNVKGVSLSVANFTKKLNFFG